MKKKPHQKQSVIKKVFSDFRERLYTPKNQLYDVQYEIKKHKKGYTVIIHRERGANQTLQFEDKEQLDAYLQSIA